MKIARVALFDLRLGAFVVFRSQGAFGNSSAEPTRTLFTNETFADEIYHFHSLPLSRPNFQNTQVIFFHPYADFDFPKWNFSHALFAERRKSSAPRKSIRAIWLGEEGGGGNYTRSRHHRPTASEPIKLADKNAHN